MVLLSGEGAQRAMKQALKDVHDPIDYMMGRTILAD